MEKVRDFSPHVLTDTSKDGALIPVKIHSTGRTSESMNEINEKIAADDDNEKHDHSLQSLGLKRNMSEKGLSNSLIGITIDAENTLSLGDKDSKHKNTMQASKNLPFNLTRITEKNLDDTFHGAMKRVPVIGQVKG